MNEFPLFTPFRGEHYADPGSLSRRLAPPYDVIGPAERERLVALDEANIVRADLPVAPDRDDPYRAAARLLGEWRARGVLVRDGSPSAYVLRTTSTFEDGGTRSRTGVFLALAAEPFSRGRVKPHEQTHQGPKEDRRRLTHATASNLSPIFVLAPDEDGRLAARLAEVTAAPPWARAEAIGAAHEVWLVSGAGARAIAETAGTGPVYIADGHHRYETAVTIRGEAPGGWAAGAKRTLSHVVSFKDPGLEILPTHRLVIGSPLDRERVLAAAARFYESCHAARASLTLVFHDGGETPLALREGAQLAAVGDLSEHTAVRSLKVAQCDAVMVATVAAQVLGRKPELRYAAVAAEARAGAKAPDVAFAIVLPATTLAEVRAVSDAGQIMPPKSTYFAPKVPTGVVLRPLEGEA